MSLFSLESWELEAYGIKNGAVSTQKEQYKRKYLSLKRAEEITKRELSSFKWDKRKSILSFAFRGSVITDYRSSYKSAPRDK